MVNPEILDLQRHAAVIAHDLLDVATLIECRPRRVDNQAELLRVAHLMAVNLAETLRQAAQE